MAEKLRNAQRYERLKELLLTKIEQLAAAEMSTRGGKARLSDAQRSLAEHEVERMLHAGDATEAALSRIVAQLRLVQPQPKSAPLARDPDGGAGGSHSASKEASHRERRARRKAEEAQRKTLALSGGGGGGGAAADLGASGAGESASAARQRAQHFSEDLWAKICARDVEQFHRDIVDQRKTAKQKEEEQRVFLDTQVQKRQAARQRLAEEERKYAEQEAAQREVWEAEAKRLEAAKLRRNEEERKVRDEQRQLAQERKAREASATTKESLIAAAKIREDLIREQEVNGRRRANAREEVTKAQAFNIEYKKVRQAALERELELDKHHQALFLQRLEQQEQARDDALQKMQERQKMQLTIALQMQATIAEKGAADERKAQAYLDKVRDREDAAAKAKADKIAEDKLRVRQYLTLQMRERDTQRDAEKAELLRLRDQIALEQKEAERKEAERKAVEKEKALAHRREVEQQMISRSQRRDEIMSMKEKELNSRLIEVVTGVSPVRRR